MKMRKKLGGMFGRKADGIIAKAEKDKKKKKSKGGY